MKKVSLLGCGLMGEPMGMRLLAAGHDLTVWNRSVDKTQNLARAGARVALSPREAVMEADMVITMLTDGQAVKEVLFGSSTQANASLAAEHAAVAGLKPQALVIDMSSIQPAQAQCHAQQLQAQGVACIDAPVSGGTLGAAAGTLAILAGGFAQDIAMAQAVLQHLGRVVHVGPHGCGQLTKLANQIIVGAGISAVAEALLLVRQGGGDMAKAREALRGGFADSRVLDVHGQRMVEGDFVKRGSLAVQLKDLRNALSTGEALSMQMPVSTQAELLFAQAAAQGLADLDQSALFLALAQAEPYQAPR